MSFTLCQTDKTKKGESLFKCKKCGKTSEKKKHLCKPKKIKDDD